MRLIQVFVKIDVAGCFVGNFNVGMSVFYFRLVRVLKISSSLLPEGVGPDVCVLGPECTLEASEFSAFLFP